MTDAGEHEDDEERLFYALIGHCVTQYQSIEDYLETIFCVAIGTDREKSNAIFGVVRGLEKKIEIISAAFIGAESAVRAKWDRLSSRIAAAANARNSIAHSNPIFVGSSSAVFDGDSIRIVEVHTPRFELHKATKAGKKVWAIGSLREEHGRSRDLYLHLIGFVRELRGEPVPEHLRGG